MLINREKIIATVINRKLKVSQIKLEEIEAAEFKYIRGSLKEDLYEAIVVDPFDDDPDFTTGFVNTSEVQETYSTGLTADGTAITGISKASEAVFTLVGHGFTTADIVYIAGTGAVTSGATPVSIDDLNRLLQYNKMQVTTVTVDTFKLTSNLVNDYLKAPLAYYAVGLAFNKIYVEVSDRGIKFLDTDKTTNVDSKTRNDIRADIFQIADALMGKARDYIYEQDYDDYDGTLDDEDNYENTVKRVGQNKRVTHF